MTNWFQLRQISHLQALRRSVRAHLTGSLAEGRCGLAMDALEARQLGEVVHSVAADVFRENSDAVASPHHRRRNEGWGFVRSRRRRIERKTNLWIESGDVDLQCALNILWINFIVNESKEKIMKMKIKNRLKQVFFISENFKKIFFLVFKSFWRILMSLLFF